MVLALSQNLPKLKYHYINRKVRDASDFVTRISKTEIISESGAPDGARAIVRRVTFYSRVRSKTWNCFRSQ